MGVLCLAIALFFCTLCPSSFAISLMGKRELVIYFNCRPDVLLLLVPGFVLMVLWVGLQCVIVVFLDQTHLLYWRRLCISACVNYVGIIMALF